MQILAPFRAAARGIRVAFDAAKENRLWLTSHSGWLRFFGTESYAGKSVTLSNSLQLATVWACVRLTAQAIAGLPLSFYRKDSRGDRQPWDDDLVELLTIQPNEDQTAVEFLESLAAWVCLQGNGYAEKLMIGQRVVGLRHLPNTVCQPRRNERGELVYEISDRGKRETLPRDRVLHIRGFSIGGDEGLSPIRFGVQTLGAAIAADQTAGRMFSNGLQTSGLLTVDAPLKGDQRQQIEETMEKFIGSDRAGKLMVLGQGMSYQTLQMNPDDAQMLESRRFSIEEICRWWGVPPIMIGHSAAGQTMWGSGVEQILIAWLTLGLNPYLTLFERRFRAQLIPREQRRSVYAEFNREGLLQADSAAKAAFLSSMWQNGGMTRNEGRAKLNLPRSDQPGADLLTAQTNLAPLDMLGAESGADGARARAAFRNWLGIPDDEKA